MHAQVHFNDEHSLNIGAEFSFPEADELPNIDFNVIWDSDKKAHLVNSQGSSGSLLSTVNLVDAQLPGGGFAVWARVSAELRTIQIAPGHAILVLDWTITSKEGTLLAKGSPLWRKVRQDIPNQLLVLTGYNTTPQQNIETTKDHGTADLRDGQITQFETFTLSWTTYEDVYVDLWDVTVRIFTFHSINILISDGTPGGFGNESNH